MRMFIDCEFNGHGGELISMALVADDDDSFYEVLTCKEPIVPWVAENVMPVLRKKPIYKKIFQRKLGEFLLRYDDVHIVADWPVDITYFCNALLLKPDKCMATPKLSFEIWRGDTTEVIPVVPHNALSDALAIAEGYDRYLNNNRKETL